MAQRGAPADVGEADGRGAGEAEGPEVVAALGSGLGVGFGTGAAVVLRGAGEGLSRAVGVEDPEQADRASRRAQAGTAEGSCTGSR